MLERLFATRHNIFVVITAVYFVPLSILTLYVAFYLPARLGWSMASFGLFASAAGALILFVLMHKWESNLLDAPSSNQAFHEGEIDKDEEQRVFALLEETKNRCQQLEEQLEKERGELELNEIEIQQNKSALQILTEENEGLQKQQTQHIQEYEALKNSAEEKLEQNMMFVSAYQQTIQEQRVAMEGKQQQISQLESKVRDLTYEIKTLLQLAEKAESIAAQGVREISFNAESFNTLPREDFAIKPAKVQSDIEALQQLKHCVESGQKITGSGHYGSRLARVRDLSIDSYALDLRHLTEGFNTDESCVIMFYSARENKPLYVNHKIKDLLDWSPEKYLQNFFSIIQDSEEDWKGMLAQLSYKHEVLGRLFMRNKAGKSLPLQCAIGVVPTGIFRGNYIAIFY